MSISHQLTQLRRAARWHRRGLAALAAAIATLAILAALRPAPPVTASVVVAAKDLPAGHRLSGTDLELSHFPSELVPRNAVPNPDIAIGETLAAPITRRSVLTRASTVSVALTPGAGELLVPVRIADGSVLGLVHVGDRVTLVTASAESQVITLASRVRVAAVPQQEETGSLSASTDRAMLVVAADRATAERLAAHATADGIGIALG